MTAIPPEAQEKIHLLLLSGLREQQILDTAVSKLKLTPKQAAEALRRARRALTLAADYHRDEQLGLAIDRLNECYARARAIADTKTALQAQRELNRLLRLYDQPEDSTQPSDPADADSRLARSHLAALGLAPEADSLPLSELARLAAAEILRLRQE